MALCWQSLLKNCTDAALFPYLIDNDRIPHANEIELNLWEKRGPIIQECGKMDSSLLKKKLWRRKEMWTIRNN